MSEQGQILENTERGRLISKIISDLECKVVLEIGTWKGMGSTMCIIQSIDDSCNFLSLESNKNFHEIAKSNLSNYKNKVNLINGTIVSVDEVIEFTKDIKLDSERKRWLDEDILNIGNCPNVYESIPNTIDFLLLDGGEFSTYVEWLKLKDRSLVVALDDIRELKTKQIFEELSVDENYELMGMTQEGNGFCVFKKK
jgi:tRNA A58 N-methylase Trm61